MNFDYVADGYLRQCSRCRAPFVDPFPPGWHIDLIKEGPPNGIVRTFVTPHRLGCVAELEWMPDDLGCSVRFMGEMGSIVCTVNWDAWHLASLL